MGGTSRRSAGLRAVLLGIAAFASSAMAIPPVPVPAENPITEEKRVLGKILFWDEQLSASNTVSCGTCHSHKRGGGDDRLVRGPGGDGILNTGDDIFGSLGVIRADAENNFENDSLFRLGAQMTGRTSNSPQMAAYAPELFWDGRASGRFVDPQFGGVAIPGGGALESQAVGPPVNSVEMSHPGRDWDTICQKIARAKPLALATQIPPDVAQAMAQRPTYRALFEAAFGTPEVTAKRIAFAIATYERTIIPDDTPFDRYLAGDPNGMTRAQIQGMVRFELHNCGSCHNLGSELLTDFSYRNIGLRPPSEDIGRQAVTRDPADRGKFKVPSLRNVWLKKTFMHNGQFETLAEVVRFYGQSPGAPRQFKDNRDAEMLLIGEISNQDLTVMVDFMQNALTDARAMFEEFPFDRPTLYTERETTHPAILPGGAPGTSNLIPEIFTPDPPMLGNLEHRIGLRNALGGVAARLVVSSQPPVNGLLTPERTFYDVGTSGTAPGEGVATMHWPLAYGQAQSGQTLYAQWIVDDPSGFGGRSRSNIARITFFCGTGGCPSPCEAIDLDGNQAIDIDDFVAFLGAYDIGSLRADVDDDGDPALGFPNRAVDINDLLFFLARFDQGC